MSGIWDPEADAKANVAYFRKRQEPTEEQWQAYADDLTDLYEPKVLLQAKPKKVEWLHAVIAGTPVQISSEGDIRNDTFVTKDSGQREDFSTGSRRDTREGKGRYVLLPPYAIQRLAQVYERGAAKYGDRNWEKGQPLSRFLDSALRHTFQVLEGKTDEDHAGQAAWNLLAFIEIQHRITEGALPEELNDL